MHGKGTFIDKDGEKTLGIWFEGQRTLMLDE
jgi:hypothetical protein